MTTPKLGGGAWRILHLRIHSPLKYMYLCTSGKEFILQKDLLFHLSCISWLLLSSVIATEKLVAYLQADEPTHWSFMFVFTVNIILF